MIPKILQKDEINFVLVEKNGKKPFEKNWQKKRISYKDNKLLEHLNNGGNYGVIGGGKKNLLIVDFDDEKIQQEIIPKLPKTFSVKTGSGLKHLYFFSDKAESFKIFNEEMDTLIDIQGEGKQAIAPGSIHPNGNKYEVVENIEIANIPYAELKAIIIPYDKKPKKEKKEYIKPKIDTTDDFIDLIKSQINFEEVLSSFGIDTSRNPTSCPFHSSKGGKCLGFNKETGHCFHCENSWNIFSLVKDYKKCNFKEALEYLASLGGFEKELEESKQKYIKSLKNEEEEEKKEIKRKGLLNPSYMMPAFLRPPTASATPELIIPSE